MHLRWSKSSSGRCGVIENHDQSVYTVTMMTAVVRALRCN